MDNQAPLQANQQNRPFKKTVPFVQGLRLLRLPPPQSPPAQVREAWGPNQPKSTMYRSSESYMGRAEPTTQPLNWNLNQYNTQTQSYTSSDRGRERDAVRLPPAHSRPDMRLPLLHLPPDTQVRPIQLPQIQLPVPMRLETAGTFAKPQLLRVEPEPSRNVSTLGLILFKSSYIPSKLAKLMLLWII